MTRYIWVLCLFLFLAGQLMAATIFLKNGQILPGRILEITDQEVILIHEGKNNFGKVYLRKEDIQSIGPSLASVQLLPAAPSEEPRSVMPEVDFSKLDQLFLKNCQDLVPKAHKFQAPRKKLLIPPLKKIVFVSPEWKESSQEENLWKLQLGKSRLSFFSIPAPSSSLEKLVDFFCQEHKKHTPSFLLLSLKIDPSGKEAEVEGQGKNLQILQKFFLHGKKLVVVTGFAASPQERIEIQSLLHSLSE